MDDKTCLKIITDIRDNTNNATRYKDRERDLEALNYVIQILLERTLQRGEYTDMHDQLKKAFEKLSERRNKND